jgi:mannose-6-phosphate isomerase-like protein (cupin superfamily)
VSEPTVVPPAGGEVIGDAPDRRVEILSDHDTLHATWSRFGPHRDGADLHIHRRHTDLFYVLEGELTLRLGPEGEGVTVPAGTLARVPPLVVHGFRNQTGAELRYLNLHAPGVGFADYMRAMRDGRTLVYDQEPPPSEGTRPATEAVVGGEALRAGGMTLLADIEEIAVADAWSDLAGPPGAARPRASRRVVLRARGRAGARGRRPRAPRGSGVVGAGAAGRAARRLVFRAGARRLPPHAELWLRSVPARAP